ncbi:MAG: peptidylprolyl isomerase [Verrucomicrobiota bacterium]
MGSVWAVPPAAPTVLIVRAEPSPAPRYVLIWDDNANDEEGYEIQARPFGNATWVSLGTVGAGSESVNYTPPSGTDFEFRVRAIKGATDGIDDSAFTPVARCLLATGAAFAPSGMFSAPLNGTTVVSWVDNNYGETNYELESRELPGGTFGFVGTLNADGNFFFITALGGFLRPGVDHEFRVRNRFGGSAPFTYSGYSNVTTVSVPPLSAPTNLVATLVGEDGVGLMQTVNTVFDSGYVIEARVVGEPSFSEIGIVAAGTTSITGITLTIPLTDYEFRTRAFFGPSAAPTAYSGYSNVAMVTTGFNAPTDLSVALIGETEVEITQNDNSGLEDGYAIEARIVGEPTFSQIGTVVADVTTITGVVMPSPLTTYEFRTRAFDGPSVSPTAYSGYSNIATATTAFSAPTVLTATAVSQSVVQLDWADNSGVEQEYRLYREAVGGASISNGASTSGSSPTFEFFGSVGADTTSALVTGLETGTSYQFQVRAGFSQGGGLLESGPSNSAMVTTQDGFTSSDHPVTPFEGAFNYAFQTTTNSPIASINLVGSELPAGLSFDPVTRTIGGTATEAGLFEVPVDVEFDDGATDMMTLTLRIVRPPTVPQVGTVISDQMMDQGVSTSIGLAGTFTDVDTESAVRMDTSLGTIDVLLYDTATPATVANFMGYVTRDDYDGTVFHRAPPGFVLQGGGFVPGMPADNFTNVTSQAPVINEPGISNLRSTISMAKIGGLVDSATNEFFFNRSDLNAPNLDFQNGGFAAFGRVPTSSMAVVDQIALLPLGSYQVTVGSNNSTFSHFPVNAPSAPTAMDNTLGVTVHSVETINEVLRYSVSGVNAGGIASAGINSMNLDITGLGPGVASFNVTATDLDGMTETQTLVVTVNQSLSQFLEAEGVGSGQNGAAQNPDVDNLNNLGEFAFLGNPNAAGDAEAEPVAGTVDDGGTDRVTITFKMRKFASGLTYQVVKSTDLIDWSTVVWDSEVDGLGASNVSTQDFPDHVLVTVTDDVGVPGRLCFLRVEVEE